MDRVDIAIIGAGVVGAAVFERLTARGLSCFLLDKRARAGGETTERNSGVVHAGLWYPPDSWKTRLCVEGNRLLSTWALEHDVPYARVTKLVVAEGAEEEEGLARLVAHGRAVGVEGLSIITGSALQKLEPGVIGSAAVLAESTGIVDPAALTASLVAAGRAQGGEVITSAAVSAIEPGYVLHTTRGELRASAVVNAAGLYADDVARMVGIDRYRIHPCRGDYYRLRTPARFLRLIYPVKKKGAVGLGVHLTIDLAGEYRLGPNAYYVDSKEDYSGGGGQEAAFAAAAGRILRGVTPEMISYESSGIRPKLRAPDEDREKDFVISEDLPRFINLVGIESPGLTSALAIAVEVGRRL